MTHLTQENDPRDIDPALATGATDMNSPLLHATLSTIASDAVPDSVDLWPRISANLNPRTRRVRSPLGARRLGLVGAAALVIVAGWTFGLPALSGQLATAQAGDIARHDPQVAAILRGDIANVTVTSLVDDVATVVVQDSTGQKVNVTVDLRSRIVTRVVQGPQLSAELAAQAIEVVRTDPRTSALIAQGATIGWATPIFVTGESIDPVTGESTVISQTWAQVPLTLDGKEWSAYVDIPQAKIDQLIDPRGNQVPLP